MIKKPYLIQRAKFKKVEHITDEKGIDKLLSFDYMGSAEFEFGALPKSLERIRANVQKYSTFDVELAPNKFVTVYAEDIEANREKILSILNDLVERKYRLKHHCDLVDYVKDTDCSPYRNDFWWDIESDWFFWVKNEVFAEKFINELTQQL